QKTSDGPDEAFLFAPNMPLGSWWTAPNQFRGGEIRASAGDQVMQFSALCSDDQNGLGHMLWFSTLDATGWYKRQRYFTHVQSDDKKPAHYTQSFSWGPVYYPPFADASGSSNYLDNPYPSALGALHARNEAYWYDAAAYYRDTFVPLLSLPRVGAPESR